MIVFCGDWLPINDITPLPRALTGGNLVINLECALKSVENTTAKAYPVYIDDNCLDNIIRLKPAAVMLANNHVYDCGDKAFKRFRRILDEHKVNYYGLKHKPYCELTVNGKKCAVIGCLEACRSRGGDIFPENLVEKCIRELRFEYDYVFVTPHWGKEGEYTGYPSPRQLKLAKQWLDVGADGIFGHHSHVFQGKIVYNGKPVFFSLGNFYFPHEEGRQYAMTDRSLCVGIDLKNTSPLCTELFFSSNSSKMEPCRGDDLAAMQQRLEKLSGVLESWSIWKWTRKIGHVYITKSDRSWKIRLRNNLVSTLPKWLVWNLLPSTLLFRSIKLLKMDSK